MEENKEQRRRRIAIIVPWVLAAILAVLNGFFIYNYFQTDKKLVVTEERLYSTDSARVEVEKILAQTSDELNVYKGKNAQLDEFLKEKNEQLQEFADRIQALLRQGKVSKEELETAQDEIDQLRYYKRKYLTQIDSLSNQVVELTHENDNLKGNINKQKRKNEDLYMENTGLKNKVAIGARLQTSALYVTGIKTRSNGKEKETIKTSQLQQLKISFNIAENYVCEKGPKDIFVKIFGPDGSTLYNEQAGSGTFRFQEEESLYTLKKTIDFTQAASTVVIHWVKGSEFAKGKYKAELYCDGFKIGYTEFELK